jgi:hypothetical protein
LLGNGYQGAVGPEVEIFNQAIRQSGIFQLQKSWPKPLGGNFELWVRKPLAPKPRSFAAEFPVLAAGLAKGPEGLSPLFEAIGMQHQLDGHRAYQKLVRDNALNQLTKNPNNSNALWSLALLGVLQNRALEAEHWFAKLEQLNPKNPWPPAYRAMVLNAAWQPWRAQAVADAGQQRSPNPVLKGLGDISGLLSAQIWRLNRARQSIPQAVQAVEQNLAN